MIPSAKSFLKISPFQAIGQLKQIVSFCTTELLHTFIPLISINSYWGDADSYKINLNESDVWWGKGEKQASLLHLPAGIMQ